RWDVIAMQLLGAAALFLTGSRLNRTPWPRRLTPVMVAVALALMAAQQVRAGFIGLAGILAFFLFYRLWRPILVSVGALLAVCLLLWVLDVQVETGRGVVSASGIIDRQLSAITFLRDGTTDDYDPQAAETAL